MTTRAALEAELREVQATIDGAYWRFTRQARALPPVLAVPASSLGGAGGGGADGLHGRLPIRLPGDAAPAARSGEEARMLTFHDAKGMLRAALRRLRRAERAQDAHWRPFGHRPRGWHDQGVALQGARLEALDKVRAAEKRLADAECVLCRAARTGNERAIRLLAQHCGVTW
jgi:hypothetical protein